MAEEKEKAEGAEAPAKKSKMVPILLGVVLVVGAAIGTVAFVLPKKQEVVKVPSIDEFTAIQYPQKIKWTWNLSSKGMTRMGVLGINFEYRTRDPLLASQAIERNYSRMYGEVRVMLADKSPEDVEGGAGLRQLKLELLDILDRSLFPENEETEDETKIQSKVSDVFILELLVK